jgi:arylformamidase
LSRTGHWLGNPALAPNLQQLLRRYASNSALVRARIGMPERVGYGSAPIEWLDIFRTVRRHAPIHGFVHGGAWRNSVAADYVFI